MSAEYNDRSDILTGVLRDGSAHSPYVYDGASSINMGSAGSP